MKELNRITFPWKKILSVFLTQITLEDGNELAEIREVFPKQLTSEFFDYDHKLTLKSFFAFCSVFFFTRTNGGKMETTSRKMPGFQNTPAKTHSALSLDQINFFNRRICFHFLGNPLMCAIVFVSL